MTIYNAAFVTIEKGATLEQLVDHARAFWQRRGSVPPTHLIVPIGTTDLTVVADLTVISAKDVHGMLGVGTVLAEGAA